MVGRPEELVQVKQPPITPGDYLVTIRGNPQRIRVLETYLYESPRTTTVLKAHWLEGFPRFPWRVSELLEAGATFQRLP